MVRREETSPKGDGSIRRYFCGEAAAAEKEAAVVAAANGEVAAEVGADNGAHRLLFGDAGLSSGSKSRVRFRVAPHAMAGGNRAARFGRGRGGRETRGAPGREERGTDALRSQAGSRAPDSRAQNRRRCLRGRGSGRGGPGGSGRGGGRTHASRVRGALPPPQAPLPREKLRPPPPSVRALRRAGRLSAETSSLGSGYRLRGV